MQNRLAVEQRQQVALDVAGRDMSNEVGSRDGGAAKAVRLRRMSCVLNELELKHTVDGRNPTPPGMYKTL